MKLFDSKNKEFIRWCNLYVESSGEKAIIVSCFNHGGLSAKIPGTAEIVNNENMSALGTAIIDKLKECTYKPEFDYSTHKKSDWPAFIASGLKTIKTFEKTFIQYQVRGVNESNLIYEIRSPELGNNISLRLSFNANDPASNIAQNIIKLNDFFNKCKKIT